MSGSVFLSDPFEIALGPKVCQAERQDCENALVVRWPGAETGAVDAPAPDPLQAQSVQALQANRPMVPGPTGAAWDVTFTRNPGRSTLSATRHSPARIRSILGPTIRTYQ